VRRPARRHLIRSLLDIRLSRFSLAVLACLSTLATVVIVTTGQGRTPAQVAALAALREPVMTVTQTVTQAAAAPSTPSAGGGGSVGGSAGGSDAAAASTQTPTPASTPTPTPASTPTPTPTDTSSGDSDSGESGSSGGGASTTAASTGTGATGATSTLPKVGHVFEIALSAPSFAAAFGHGSAAPYLRSLEAKGTLLKGYDSLGDGELADYLAGVSGQAPNADTSAGCATYADFPQADAAKADGIVSGRGCVYPETALTIGDQVSSAGHVWKAYIEGEGRQTCSHPNSDAADDVALTGTDPGYDTRHNPFIYFHSLLDLGDCASDDVDLTKLPGALASKHATATLSYIAPGQCDDAVTTASTTLPAAAPVTAAPGATTSSTTTASSPATSTTTTSSSAATSTTTSSSTAPAVTPAPATCPSGQPLGIAGENAFLKQWVPRILASAAYRANGVLVIDFAGAGVKRPAKATPTGALVLSRWTHHHRTITRKYQPYSLLRSVEEMLGATPLAHAKQAPSFATAVLDKSL
jgi:hypothetical protein